AHTSVTDPLTGTGNRRLGEMLLHSLKPDDAVAIIDIDNFKQVNDSLGHPAGDRILQRLGQYLRSCVRHDDGVARMGGEEFLVVLRGAGSMASDTLERILEGWRMEPSTPTISIGLALHSRLTSHESTYQAA